mmetsp:Transcript_33888/g.89809  ORF Transcript_33888/g.89809 Transcript_33888/m.89809 type:complete len:354 (+) Transcript_33888:74-1135(+)
MRTASALLASLLCAQGLSALAQNATANATAVATTAVATTATTTTTPPGRTLVHVQGQSGKFTIYNENEGLASGIQINMDALRELDSAGQAVGASGSTHHSINTFAAQEFTIEPVEAVTLRAGQLEDGVNASGEAQGVSADKISFHSPVSTIGQIRVDTYIIKEDGLLGPPNETWTVRAGDIKWNIELSSWSWCGCSQGQTQQVGDMVDVDVTVKGLFDASQGASSKAILLGGGATLELSDQVNVDGEWARMPAGYPLVSFQGKSTTLTFRFPKFTTRVVYDPAITGLSSAAAAVTTTTAAGGQGGAGDTTTAATTTAAATTAAATTEVPGRAAAATAPVWLAACLVTLLAGMA